MEYFIELAIPAEEAEEMIAKAKEEAATSADGGVVLQAEFEDGTIATVRYLLPGDGYPYEAFELTLSNIGGCEDASYCFNEDLREGIYEYWRTGEGNYFAMTHGVDDSYAIDIVEA